MKSNFQWLSDLYVGPNFPVDVLSCLDELWKIQAPSNYLKFGWRLLHKKFMTQMELENINFLFLEMDMSCPYYFSEKVSG